MPSRLPRTALTLPEGLAATLQALAAELDKPVASVVVDLLGEMEEQLKGLTKLLRASKAGNKAATKRALVHMVGDGMAELMTQQQPELFDPSKKKRK